MSDTLAQPVTTSAHQSENVELLQGYDRVSGEVRMAKAATGREPSTFDANSELIVKFADTREQIAELIDISDALAVNAPGIVDVSAKLHFLRSLKCTRHSRHLVVRNWHSKGTQELTEASLKSDLNLTNPLSSNEGLSEFHRIYGDSYVSAVTEGMEFIAVVSFFADSRQQLNDLKGSLKAKGIADGVEISNDLSTQLKDVSKSSSTTLTYDAHMTGVDKAKFPQPDFSAVFDFAKNFSQKEASAPEVISFKLQGYEHLKGMDASFERIARNRKLFTGAVTSVLAKANSVLALKAQIDEIKNTYSYYRRKQRDEKLESVRSIVETDILAIKKLKEKYDKKPCGDFSIPGFPSLEKGNPTIRVSVGHSDQWGGKEGVHGPNVFDFPEQIETFLKHRGSISRIEMRGGNYVDRLAVTYSFSGSIAQQNVQSGNVTKLYGGSGGKKSYPADISPATKVKSIVVNDGKYIDHLTFNLSDGTMIDAGGTRGHKNTKLIIPEDALLIGFRGRYGDYLDRLQAFWFSWRDASWSD